MPKTKKKRRRFASSASRCDSTSVAFGNQKAESLCGGQKRELRDYYATVQVETIIYFQAENREDAEVVAEEISSDLQVDMCSLCPKKYKNTDVDTDGYEVSDIHLHE